MAHKFLRQFRVRWVSHIHTKKFGMSKDDYNMVASVIWLPGNTV